MFLYYTMHFFLFIQIYVYNTVSLNPGRSLHGVAHGFFGSSHEPPWTANPHSVFILVSPLPSSCAFSPSFFVKRPSPGITRDDDVPHAASRSTLPDSWFFSLRAPHKETKWNTCLARVGREEVNPAHSQTITHSCLIYITIELWKFRPFQKLCRLDAGEHPGGVRRPISLFCNRVFLSWTGQIQLNRLFLPSRSFSSY